MQGTVGSTRASIRTWAVAVMAASFLFASGVAPASAEALKWKLGYHLTKVETSEVGDAPGHALVLGRGSGVAFFTCGRSSWAFAARTVGSDPTRKRQASTA